MSFDFSTASDLTTDSLNYFSERAEDYQKYRPNYPASAIDTILSGLGGLLLSMLVQARGLAQDCWQIEAFES